MTKGEFKLKLIDGLLLNNPVLVQLLGMCSTLAVTTNLFNGLGMGIATTIVLTMSNLIISLIRKFVPKQIRIASFIVVISGFVTAIELLIRAYVPVLDKSLGIFIPLIVVNCIILARAEAFASKNPPLPSVVDGLVMGLGFASTLVVLSVIREIIGYGTIGGLNIFGENFKGATLIAMPAGAFITLGIIIATTRYFVNKSKQKC
ncbi:MAG: electron transport complex subunit RsxE [Clostridiales bacterium GWF2_38_85]|nr:MAG: electron transport complex subunit RsxE [Clostridiales bacterium GWF2_38_85]HBL85047.1 electron transport complex subunit RsxE [Clostridiales bacterium]